ncbi:unnamed protein product [Rotaria sordida]|uniref:Uncharacterized protein n=1 Tax=Rotaria sordida TaxID=392033 RepID=A0A818UJ05_9BILA|nr:unnamed protein product [Rotaria sordida]CAF3698705.1 unnamed protein product [Rotaria sordida]
MLQHHGSRLIDSPNFQQLYTSRFVPLFIHLILLILIFVYRDELVNNCSINNYANASNGLIWSDAWTGASLGLVLIEMILSLSGFSIFRYYAVIFSIVLHSAACVVISGYFMSDMSICMGLPYLLFFCTFLPLRMATNTLSSHSSIPPGDISTLNSYGALSHNNDIEVLPSTTVINSTSMHNNESNSTISNHYKSPKTSCLKPQQSETIFAIFLFTLGLSLLIYVIVSYWFTHSQISPIIIFICGLLCFIPGCYYLVEHYSFIFKCKRNRHRQLRTIDQDDII